MGDSTLKDGASFGKKEKLKSQTQISKLFAKGNSISVYPLKLIYLKNDDQEVKIKTAVAVAKKNFKSAVKRNRIKRLLRETYRLNKALVFNNTQGKFTFLFLYLGKEMPTFENLASKMPLLLRKFNAQIHEKNNTQ
ncbi:ribonuclease P protein component [Maribacter sp. CXY002]|uniref:ribonuclease P protein component n=1 Tax=Maribacter luteocoastalis TaxID=3407671 RepID=UPI003B685F25